MEQKAPTAFISYSWDSQEHQNWVHFFVNELRGKHVEADFDRFVTQEKTTNLNQMMIKAIRDYDYVIIVLTENYARKADNFEGGVGFETLLSLPDLQRNPGKLILVMRHQGDYKKVFPFHLQGYHAIDFSKSEDFEEKFMELAHRIHKVPLLEKAPLGPNPFLQPKPSAAPTSPPLSPFADLVIPKAQEITDVDKMEFIRGSFKELIEGFTHLFETVKAQVSGFTYTVDDITSQKRIFLLFLNGRLVSGVKIWLGGLGFYGSSQMIGLAYGTSIDPNNDNIYNEIIMCEEVGNELRIKMTLNRFGNNPKDPIGIVKQIWTSSLSHALN